MQLYKTIYDYIYDYEKLLYDVYSKNVVSYLTTYYHLDLSTTVWDDKNLMGGYYERIGELSGVKWNKILLLPVFFVEAFTNTFDAEERGYISSSAETQIVIPDSYGIVPYPNDVIKFDQSFINTNSIDSKDPLWTCTNTTKSTFGDKTFIKLHMTLEQTRTTDDMDLQTSETYTFYDYTKNIYTLDDAAFMTKILSKSQTVASNLKNMYDKNTGFYFL